MARAFNDDGRFWVVFDTSTRPAYYRDVHNLLAAPAGAVLRYDYKAKYISDEATAAIADEDGPLPSRILFAYAQHREYHRGDASPKALDDFNSAVWVGTRLGRMVLVAEHAGEYFLDFEVLDYPNVTRSVTEILRRQFERREAPLHKWIGFSIENGHFSAAAAGSNDDNWAAIVDTLSSPPSQFAGDAFWRVVALRASGSAGRATAVPTAEMEGPHTRQVRSHFPLRETSLYSAEIATKRSQQSRAGGPPTEFRVQARSDQNELVRVVGTGLIDVRQYTRDHVELECAGLGFLVSRAAQLTLNTIPADGDWPQGPELTLRFRIGKKWGISLFSLVTLAAGVVLGSTSLWKLVSGTSETVLAALGAAAGIVLGTIGATLWTGKLTSK
jgi:hypothetical protein